ncbi:hypothetical protein K4L06_00950 [Lysobacter sp. BMK333-48F3]|uniref:hypothetical protein n=1 Tax=Lysobacter sp. BMK333-48F3 TaxID=2867962 RepID=UPI001C8C4B9A|nr:hypothetical protein [Lysobacter sp. BMK333-48F3]MBX9399861.1 hypothetical protein [Lysobacter sp. BMK333-48F3]
MGAIKAWMSLPRQHGRTVEAQQHVADEGEVIHDPAAFDVWAKVKKGSAVSLADWLSAQCSIGKMGAYRAIRSAVEAGAYVRLYFYRGASQLPQLLSQMPAWIIDETVVVTESDCDPNNSACHCAVHDILHSPPVCPVCSGDFIY